MPEKAHEKQVFCYAADKLFFKSIKFYETPPTEINKISRPEVSTSAQYNIIFVRNKKLFQFSCMKSDLNNRPLETICCYGQRRLAAPPFTLTLSRR